MLTSIIESPRKIVIRDISLPDIGDEEVLIKLEGTGLCSSNLPVWEGREWFNYPFEPGAPGHEGYGTVESAGSRVQNIKKGDKVAFISYNAYAQYDKTHYLNVTKLPESLQKVPFPGEPVACAVNIFKRSEIFPGQKVVVIGGGFMGCLLIQLLKNEGATVIAVARRKTSIEYSEKAGADIIVKYSDVWQTARELNNILTDQGATRIIEVTGLQEALDIATEVISVRGLLVIAGYHQNGLRNINMQKWNWKGIDVINAHERDQNVYNEGLKEAVLLSDKQILKPFEFITHQFDLKRINNAFETLSNRPEGFLKAVITFS